MRNLGIFVMLMVLCSCCIGVKDKPIERKVYSELNKVIEDSFVVNKDCIYQMEMKIQGNIKGKGSLSYGHVVYFF